MIYVVIEEVGSYSDYRCNLLFASTNKNIAEKKVAEYKDKLVLAAKLSKELDSEMDAWRKREVPQYYVSGRLISWQDYYNVGMATKEHEFRMAKIADLEAQHNFESYGFVKYAGSDATYSVIPVESELD